MMDLLTREGADGATDPKPYHHGDLSRALVAAAQTILERDGLQALSLRAVAREAGVSPAAPYHHFKDKSELLDAVAHEAFEGLTRAMKAARDADPDDALVAMGVAYVVYARENPSRYRVMWDCSRDKSKMPEDGGTGLNDNGYALVKRELVASGVVQEGDELGLELAAGAMWCAVHGLAEMASFEHFKPLVEATGGELAFYRATLEHLGYATAQ